MLSFEQRLQLFIGGSIFQLIAKEVENEQLKTEAEQLKTQIPEKSPAEPEPPVEK